MTESATLTAQIISGMPIEDYLAGPWMSHSKGRSMLSPSCPAKGLYRITHSEPPKQEFDFGKTVHHLVLGDDEIVEVLDFPNYRTKAAQEAQAAAYAAGHIPVLRHQYEECVAMADAVKLHPKAGPLFSDGKPEQVIIWDDERLPVQRAARLDWLPTVRPGQRMVIGELKTTTCAHPDELTRKIHDYAYDSQDAWNVEAVRAAGLDDDPTVALVFIEKDPPHLITVVELDDDYLAIGHARNREAISDWHHCVTTGRWPGYHDDEIAVISPPTWLLDRYRHRI